MLLPSLLVLSVALSLYDLRTGKVPNWVTLPLLGLGLLIHFPGTLELWLAGLLIFSAWVLAWISAGDAKLWLALLWWLPLESVAFSLLRLAVTFCLTAVFQIAWRKFKHQPLTGRRTPGAWRTIPFILWSLCDVH